MKHESAEPWGPWSTAFYTMDWGLGPTFYYRLPVKWMSPDGLTVDVLFSGSHSTTRSTHYDAFSVRRMVFDIYPR